MRSPSLPFLLTAHYPSTQRHEGKRARPAGCITSDRLLEKLRVHTQIPLPHYCSEMTPTTRPPPGSSTSGDAPVVHQKGRGGAELINAVGRAGAVVVIMGAMIGLPMVRATSAGLSHTCTVVTDNTIKVKNSERESVSGVQGCYAG